ncbi:PAS domain-containing protein, partial [archaeon]|nr:PAS domain-containing protein [archaeon]
MSNKEKALADYPFKTIFENMEEGVMVIDKNYKITDVNSAILKRMGLKKKDVIGKRCHEVSHNRTSPCKPPHECPYKEVMKTGKQFRVVHTHFDKKGNEIYVELTAFPIKDNGNKITHIIEISRDITERRKAQEEIGFLASIIKNLPDAVCSIDTKGNIISWNEGAEKMLGYKVKEILGKPILKIIPQELGKKELEHCINILGQGRSLSGYESTRVAKDGRVVLVELTGVALKDENQNIVSYASIMHDITERKEMENALSKQTETSQKYLDLAGSIMLVIGKDQRVKVVNRRLCKVLGYKEEEIVGKNWFDTFIPKNDMVQVKKVFNQLIKGKVETTEYYENTVLTKSGEERLIAWHNAVIRDAKG